MSTNYYLVNAEAVANNVPLDWMKQIHIAQYSANGFNLQAVRGHYPFSALVAHYADHAYVSPVDGFNTIETWEDWKNALLNPLYVVISEYGNVIDTHDFINDVENSDRSHRYNHMNEWMRNASYPLAPTHYLDPDGFSFEVREFF